MMYIYTSTYNKNSAYIYFIDAWVCGDVERRQRERAVRGCLCPVCLRAHESQTRGEISLQLHALIVKLSAVKFNQRCEFGLVHIGLKASELFTFIEPECISLAYFEVFNALLQSPTPIKRSLKLTF